MAYCQESVTYTGNAGRLLSTLPSQVPTNAGARRPNAADHLVQVQNMAYSAYPTRPAVCIAERALVRFLMADHPGMDGEQNRAPGALLRGVMRQTVNDGDPRLIGSSAKSSFAPWVMTRKPI